MCFGEQKKDGGKKIGLASYIISLKEKKTTTTLCIVR
jgi:hypothetical protein